MILGKIRLYRNCLKLKKYFLEIEVFIEERWDWKERKFIYKYKHM